MRVTLTAIIACVSLIAMLSCNEPPKIVSKRNPVGRTSSKINTQIDLSGIWELSVNNTKLTMHLKKRGVNYGGYLLSREKNLKKAKHSTITGEVYGNDMHNNIFRFKRSTPGKPFFETYTAVINEDGNPSKLEGTLFDKNNSQWYAIKK
jgi:hypothetical protein